MSIVHRRIQPPVNQAAEAGGDKSSSRGLPHRAPKTKPPAPPGNQGFSPSAARRREGRRHPGLLRAELLDQHIELGQFGFVQVRQRGAHRAR
ncbi:hypothetical protein, partial [Burkholderia gladioli]|uniref:hypothetical protein n=1 Tax=Burkholderia gladioli TaxID=28095 RepID=UPI001ABBB9ED